MNPRFWTNKRVFITGHTGFKGSWLSLWLLKHGAIPYGYAIAPADQPSLFRDAGLENAMDGEFADVEDFDRLRASIAAFRPSIILHLAAQPIVCQSYEEPIETFRTNVLGTVHALEAARRTPGVRVFLNVTTDKVYENDGRRAAYSEEDRLGGHDPYSTSKACSELVTESYRRSFFTSSQKSGIGVATARSGNVIGGGDWAKDRLIPDIVRAFSLGNKPPIRNPEAVRPWQHVMEPLHGYLMLTEALWQRQRYAASAWNFGPPLRLSKSVAWVADRMAELWEGSPGWTRDKARHGHEARLLKLNSQKAARFLGWSSVLPIDRTLSWVHAWYSAYLAGEDAAAITRRQIDDYEELLHRTTRRYE